MDLFTDVTLFQIKNKPRHSIYHAEFRQLRSFVRICCKLIKIREAKLANFYKEIYAGASTCPLESAGNCFEPP